MRGSKPGERRGGRQAGTPNVATREIKVLIEEFAPDAIKELGRLSTSAKNEATRLAAIKEILDRRFGKASQIIGGDPENPLSDISSFDITNLLAFLLEKQANERAKFQQKNCATQST